MEPNYLYPSNIDPAPLPMRDEEDTDLRAVYPADPEPVEDENWMK